MRRVAFRVDASAAIGTGHVGRCLTLARALRSKGIAVSFICRAHGGDWSRVIEAQGFDVQRLPSHPTRVAAKNERPYAAWLGASWEQDAEETADRLAPGAKPDWLIVDHYGVDERWERALRDSATRLMIIDDLADRRHECDVMLDQNLVADIDTRYCGKVPHDCRMLLGPQYALLDPAYGDLHERIAPREGSVRRILVSFGGADREDLAARSLKAFASLGRADIEIDVVIPAGQAHESARLREAFPDVNLQIHSGLPTLAPLMARADLAIGAAGVTTWERLCVGLPSLVITLADNQRPIAERLSQLGLIRWLGHANQVDDRILAGALGEIIRAGIDREQSERSLRLVDGKGTDRVTTVLTVSGSTAVRARPAAPDDEALLLEWANDPVTRQHAFSSTPIPEATHRTWFRDRLRDEESCRMYVVETDARIPVGQVRFDLRRETWEISYLVAPLLRGRGLGRPVLTAALSRLRDAFPQSRVRGLVKPDNHASRRIFSAMGFELGTPHPNGAVVFERAL